MQDATVRQAILDVLVFIFIFIFFVWLSYYCWGGEGRGRCSLVGDLQAEKLLWQACSIDLDCDEVGLPVEHGGRNVVGIV